MIKNHEECEIKRKDAVVAHKQFHFLRAND